MQLRNDVAHVAEGEKSTRVTWAQSRGRRVSIGASPVDVSELFRERVLYQTRGVILTSATLSTSGSFEFIEKRLGIDFPPMRETLPSPFDYARQAALYLPDLPDPRDAAFGPRAADEIVSLVELTGGGAFVLCTSLRAMEDLARRCRPRLRARILIQGEAPKHTLLDRFRADGHAVLFATASFWEGVDVPGDALRLVIIDKLPFEVPSDPLVAARCKRMEDAGEPSFMSYVVPAAALALKQGFGRLIRTARDRGIVAVLDRRLTRKGYGRVFLRSLPDARRCTTREELHAFWNEGAARELLSTAPTVH
jgi:ATP-dependent DNA helicase DinG